MRQRTQKTSNNNSTDSKENPDDMPRTLYFDENGTELGRLTAAELKDRRRQLERQYLAQIESNRRGGLYILVVLALLLLIFLVFVYIPQFFYCVMGCSISSFFIVLTSLFPSFYFHHVGRWIYGFYFLGHFLMILASIVLESLTIYSYLECQKGYNCQEFQSYAPYYWPYSLALAVTALTLLASGLIFYDFVVLLFERIAVEEQNMKVSSSTQVAEGIQMTDRKSFQYSPLRR